MAKALELPDEQRIVLREISWETYEHILTDHLDSSAPRFTYDRGVLEIVSPSPEHEGLNRRIAHLVLALAEEREIDVEDLGSTTFRREDLQRGFEPDSCFYFQNAGRIRGKARIDLSVDPPPELVVEIDVTSPSLNKLPIYVRIGVPEVWRYDGERAAILELAGGEYAEVSGSGIFPALTSETLTRFIEESTSLERPAWMRRVREWSRGHSG